jgi:hypothetical protein
VSRVRNPSQYAVIQVDRKTVPTSEEPMPGLYRRRRQRSEAPPGRRRL